MIADFATLARCIGLRAKLLVLVPHPDDETLGCGGLLAMAADAGIETRIILVTDGGASHPGSKQWPRARLAALRALELDEALRSLGVDGGFIRLELPDAGADQVSPSVVAEARDKIVGALSVVDPDVILTTWRREPHCDHRLAFQLAIEGLRLAGSRASLVEYMVWTPLAGSRDDHPRDGETRSFLLDVSAVRHRKLEALQCHQSQLGHLIEDDPCGFRLSAAQIAAMTGPFERYEQSL